MSSGNKKRQGEGHVRNSVANKKRRVAMFKSLNEKLKLF